jgi:hypothetical protein
MFFAGRRIQDAATPDGLQTVSASVTRPADTTAYAAGDLVANSTTAGSVVPLAFSSAVREEGSRFRIERIRLRTSSTSLTNASFRVYIFRGSPTVSVGDNGALNASSVLAIDDVQYLVGWADITLDRSATAGAAGRGVPSTGSGMTEAPATGTTLYGLIEATAAYTPTSAEVFTVTLEGQWS